MKHNRQLLISWIIALGLVGLGILANWYMVYVWANQPLEAPNPYQQLYEDLLYPSVRIETENGIGSGVVIASREHRAKSVESLNALSPTLYAEIYILTAAHVVGDYTVVTVTFYTPLNPLLLEGTCQRKSPLEKGRGVLSLGASVVLTDTVKDLALIKIITDKPYPYAAKLALRNYVPYIFTPVWVVGCSLGLPPRPSEGIITSIEQRAKSEEYSKPYALRSTLYWEISAPIWPGNSGGGVFLKDTHELIGIAVWVKVYRGQLVSTMAGVVPLQAIYEFLHSPLIRGDKGVCYPDFLHTPAPLDRGD
jgi:S1-C subfamily serine protease